MTPSISLDRLRHDGQAFMEEMSREYYLALGGLKATAELQPIYEKYAGIMTPDALAMATEAFRGAASGSEQQQRSRIMLEWLVGLQSGRELATMDEREMAWQASAMISLPDGSKVQFERAPIDIANANDKERRSAVEEARAKLVLAELAPLRRDRFQRERDIIERLELADGYNATWELITGISLSDLRAQCEGFLRDTSDIWRDMMPPFIKRILRVDNAWGRVGALPRSRV